MKVGDRVLCISDSYPKGFVGEQKCHIESKYYTIDDLSDIYVYVNSEKDSTWNGYYGYSYEDFVKYFITVKELRKLKLDKINENK